MEPREYQSLSSDTSRPDTATLDITLDSDQALTSITELLLLSLVCVILFSSIDSRDNEATGRCWGYTGTRHAQSALSRGHCAAV